MMVGTRCDVIDSEDVLKAERGENVEDNVRKERLFAYYSSTSITILVSTTITAISTCLSTARPGATACVGRKRRLVDDKSMQLDEFQLDNVELSSSQAELESWDEAGPRVTKEVQKDDGRKGRNITIWSTIFTTLTITSTSAMTGTTVTASILCAMAGLVQSCFLG